ncbi:hypothetical protein [Listeria cornellensis]|nr:hypothetical protein [Listeria cornellensis]
MLENNIFTLQYDIEVDVIPEDDILNEILEKILMEANEPISIF